MQPHKAERTALKRVKLLNTNDFSRLLRPSSHTSCFCAHRLLPGISPSFPLPTPSLISSCLSPINLATISLIFTHTMKSPEPAQVVLTLCPVFVATVPCTNSYHRSTTCHYIQLFICLSPRSCLECCPLRVEITSFASWFTE